MEVVESGLAFCILEPLGAHGLGNYVLGRRYSYLCVRRKGMREVRYRVLPNARCTDVWEMCMPDIFNRYFQKSCTV